MIATFAFQTELSILQFVFFYENLTKISSKIGIIPTKSGWLDTVIFVSCWDDESQTALCSILKRKPSELAKSWDGGVQF